MAELERERELGLIPASNPATSTATPPASDPASDSATSTAAAAAPPEVGCSNAAMDGDTGDCSENSGGSSNISCNHESVDNAAAFGAALSSVSLQTAGQC